VPPKNGLIGEGGTETSLTWELGPNLTDNEQILGGGILEEKRRLVSARRENWKVIRNNIVEERGLWGKYGGHPLSGGVHPEIKVKA